MELQQLKTFAAIAKTQSFTQASELLDYAQSSVSNHIRLLEEDLGTRLFERIGKRVFLTEAGERLLPYVNKILKLEQEVREVVQCCSTPRGRLIIGAPESVSIYRLPEILQGYRSQYPQVEIILKLGSCYDLIQWLKDNQVDVVLLLEDKESMPELVTEKLRQEQMVLVTGSSHPLAGQDIVTTADLNGQQLILIEKDACYRCLFEEQLAAAGVTPASVLEIGSIETVKKCLASGLGVSLLPAMAVEQEIALGSLQGLRWGSGDFAIYTMILHHKDKWLSPALDAFIQMARKLLKL